MILYLPHYFGFPQPAESGKNRAYARKMTISAYFISLEMGKGGELGSKHTTKNTFY